MQEHFQTAIACMTEKQQATVCWNAQYYKIIRKLSPALAEVMEVY